VACVRPAWFATARDRQAADHAAVDRLLGRPGDVQDPAAPTMIRVITGVPSSEDED